MKMKIGIGLAALSALAKCLGGCREAARVFSGSPTAPDPVFLSQRVCLLK